MTNTKNPRDRSLLPDSETILRDVLKHRGWDEREGQVTMVECCAAAVEDDEMTDQIVKAPVGTGKSLAAAISIIGSGRRGIICTSTKALQNQYVNEELRRLADDLRELYGFEMTYTVLKGQSNYACMASAMEVAEGKDKSVESDDDVDVFGDDEDVFGSLEPSVTERIKEIVEDTQGRMQGATTENVALDSDTELQTLPHNVSRAISAARSCGTRKKTWRDKSSSDPADDLDPSEYEAAAAAFEASSGLDDARPLNPASIVATTECAYRMAYAKALVSDITVMNTHLFAAELHKYRHMKEMAFVPKQLSGAEVIVIDEGHHVTEILSSSMSVELDFKKYRGKVEASSKSLAGAVGRYADKFDPKSFVKANLRIVNEAYAEIEEMTTTGSASTFDLAERIRKMANALAAQAKGCEARGLPNADPDGVRRIKNRTSRFFEDAVGPATELTDAMTMRYEDDETGRNEFSFWTQVTPADEDFKREIIITAVPIDLTFFRNAVGEAVRDTEGSPLERAMEEGSTSFTCAGRSTIILCSGTITEKVGSKIGMEHDSTPYDAVESPFDTKRLRICVPSILPETPTKMGWFDKAWETARQSIEILGGRTLFLCTSNKNMREFAERAREDFPNLTVMVQGEMDRDLIIEEFKRDEGAIIFGVKSFSEGIDIPGQALSQVIIDKIAFPIKDDPVFVAQRKAVERKSRGNPFMEVDVDHAAIGMAQSVGRGQRAASDRVGCLILDRRITTARYGAKVMSLVPEVTPFTEKFDTYLDWIEWVAESDDDSVVPSLAGWNRLRSPKKRRTSK